MSSDTPTSPAASPASRPANGRAIHPEMRPGIPTAIVGIGNCASALLQAIAHCRAEGERAIGLAFAQLGGYAPGDVTPVLGFDVDARKVGLPLARAAMAAPNCTTVFHPDLSAFDAPVLRGPGLDGIAPHMQGPQGFLPSDAPEPDKAQVVAALREAGAEVMILFLPVGAQKAAEFYAECAIEAGCALVNGFPVFIASDPGWAARFADAGLPVLGDDFKAQFGATVLHRTLVDLARMRGVEITRTYQLNVGGNTDFLNMSAPERLGSKRESKTEAVQAAMAERLDGPDIRIGPSDHVAWLKDRKVAHIRLEGRLLGGAPTSIELRLEVEDSPNAASEALTALRCARIALDRGLCGPIEAASAFLFKHPPVQMPDPEARAALLRFADGPQAQD